jgi:hypothetical protein
LPVERLALHFEIAGTGRKVAVTGEGPLLGRFRRSRAIRAFLDRAAWACAHRRFLQGDASTRAYERVGKPGQKAVLMDWPPPRTGAGGDPRAMVRARDVRPFMAVDIALREAGLSAPEIYAADTDAGFLLMEDLGSAGIVAGERPIPERYRLAISALAEIHLRPRAADLPLADGGLHRLPDFSAEVLAAELELFPDWYIPHLTGKSPSAAERKEFFSIWAPLLDRLGTAETSWTLLDVHSPNLLWLPDRQGIRRIGFLDFQDAMIGPSAYDVASLDLRPRTPSCHCRRSLPGGAEPDFHPGSDLFRWTIAGHPFRSLPTDGAGRTGRDRFRRRYLRRRRAGRMAGTGGSAIAGRAAGASF